MKQKHTIFTARITMEDSKKLKAVAHNRQLTQSDMLRTWIDNSYRAMKAKKKAQ